MPDKNRRPKKRPARPVKPSAAAPKAAAPRAAARPAPAVATHDDGKWSGALGPRTPGERRYWLVKSEPEVFSFTDLLRAPNSTTHWDGVRNFVARNFLRDGMKKGDQVFFYHSGGASAIVGVCEVVREGYPDATALDPKHAHFDEKSDPEDPAWYMVDLKALTPLANQVSLARVKAHPELVRMTLVRIGRLSVTPVTADEWETITKMAESPA